MHPGPIAGSAVADEALGRRGAVAFRWLTIAVAARMVLAFGVQVYFARLLGPDLYGVFAGAAMVILVVTTVTDLGLSWAMLQAPRLEHDAIRFALTWQLVVGALAAGTLALMSEQAAALLREPRAAPILQVMALSVVVTGLLNSGQNLMLRHLRSRTLAAIQLIAYLFYCGVSYVLSLMGLGIWSLVIGIQVYSLLLLLLYVPPLLKQVSLREVRPAFDAGDAVPLVKTAALGVVTAATNWMVTNIERAFIARMLGSAPLGNYTTASNVANVPTSMLISAVTPLFLTLGGRMVEQPERIGGAFQRLLTLVFVLAMPAFAALAMAADALIVVVYGWQWLQAAPVLHIVLMTAPALIVAGIATPVLWNTGRAHHESIAQWLMLPLQMGALWYAVQFGLIAMALVASLAVVMRSVLFTVSAARATGVALRKVFAKLMLGAALTVLAMLVSSFASWALGDPAPWITILLPTVLGVASVAGMLLALPTMLAPAEWSLMVALFPEPVRGWLRGYLSRRLPSLEGSLQGDMESLSRRRGP